MSPLSPVRTVTDGGDGSNPASGTFILAGDSITITATDNGDAFNGVDVEVVADATVSTSAEYSDLDKKLTIHVLNDGSSTTNDVEQAIDDNNVPEFSASGGTGTPVVFSASYSGAVSGGDARHPAEGKSP